MVVCCTLVSLMSIPLPASLGPLMVGHIINHYDIDSGIVEQCSINYTVIGN